MSEPTDKTVSMGKRMTQHVRKNFVSGLLVLVPAGITFIAFRFLFSIAARLLEPVLKSGYNGKVPDFVLVGISIFLLIVDIFNRFFCEHGYRKEIDSFRGKYSAEGSHIEKYLWCDKTGHGGFCCKG